MSNGQHGFSRISGFLGMPRTRLAWRSIGLAATFFVLCVLWLLHVKPTPISPRMYFFNPMHAFLLLGAVAAQRYRIVRHHAQGGLGAVYVAHDEELHREVALKEILERHAHSSENRERFVLEAEVTGGLEHPGIVPVYGLGEYKDGRPFYAMRFIRGDSLNAAIGEFHKAESPNRDPGERALALRRVLTHFVDVCEAIAYAHSRGVLHRDIKPENIMLGKFGETLVVDWGLAKPLGKCFAQDQSPRTGIRASNPSEPKLSTLESDDAADTTPECNDPGAPGDQNVRPLVPAPIDRSTETTFEDRPLVSAPIDRSAETTFEDRPLVSAPIDRSAETTFEDRPLVSAPIDRSAETTFEERPLVPAPIDRSADTLDVWPVVPAPIDRSAETLEAQPLGRAAIDRSAETLDQGPLGPAAIDRSAETLDQGPLGPAASDRSAETLDQRPPIPAFPGRSFESLVRGEVMRLGPDGNVNRRREPSDPGAQGDHAERPLVPASHGRSSRTHVGSRMGTPAYMSPEQAAGLVDRLGPASDIYSLGATLYSILTGRPPFTGGNITKTLARVVEGDFPAPRKVKPSIPRALEAIVLKAMALKPEDRYPTPKALSDDIEHWMADEPVWAYRDPWPARMARWARRHKTTVGVSAALLLAAVASLSAGSILLERERARTDRERALAVKNYRYAYEAAETMLSRVGDVDLADIPQMEPVRRELLETAKAQFDNLLEQQSTDPEIILLEGRTRARLGGVLEMMGQYGDAERNDREAVDSLRALESRDPADDRPLREIARAHHGLGVLLRKLNRFRDGESELREAVRLREQLAAKSSSDHAAAKALADSRYQLGALLARLASRPEDKALYNQAIKDQEAELSVDPTQPENRVKLAQYRNNLAILEARTNPTLAEREYRKILELLADLSPAQKALPGVRWQTARASNNLAKALMENPPRVKASETQLTMARDELDRLTAEFPQIRQYRRELASVSNNLGLLALNRDKPQEAEVSFRQTAKLLKELAASDPQVPDYQQNLSIALFQLEHLRAATDLPGAREGMARILADQDRLIASHPEVPDYRNALGRNLMDYSKLLLVRGDAREALPLAERAVARFHEALLADPGNLAYTGNRYNGEFLKLKIALALKDPETAARSADGLVEVLPNRLDAYLRASMGFAQCIVLVSGDKTVAPEVRVQRSDAFGQRAVDLLRQAADRHLLNAANQLLVEELKPLFGRTDFKNLVKELIARQQPVNG